MAKAEKKSRSQLIDGDYVRRLLKNQGITHTAFADKIGVERETFSRWITGVRAKHENAIAIAKALNIPLLDIIIPPGSGEDFFRLTQIWKRLGVNRRSELVGYAWRMLEADRPDLAAQVLM